MEQELQQQLAKTTQDFTSTLSMVKDSTLEQIPEIIHPV